MAYSDPNDVWSAATEHATGRDDAVARLRLPTGAQRTLTQIAEALGVTTALLRERGTVPEAGEDVCLAEASALLQAYIRISDPGTRQRCLAFVQQAAASARPA